MVNKFQNMFQKKLVAYVFEQNTERQNVCLCVHVWKHIPVRSYVQCLLMSVCIHVFVCMCEPH